MEGNIDMKTKKLSRMLQKFVAVLLTVVLFVLCPISGVYADDGEGEGAYALDNATAEDGYLDDGAIYALFNTGTELWASTAYNAATAGTHNLFQHSSWSNTAQNFRFVKSNRQGVDNVYFIYPLEYNNGNADEIRVLGCDYSQIENGSASRVNVLPVSRSSTDMEGYEWLVELQSDGSYAIKLYADQRYMLSAVGGAAGSVTTTGVSQTGNICVRKSGSDPGTVQKWSLKYVIPNGNYIFHNKGNDQYLQPGTLYGSTVQTNQLYSREGIAWTLQHISNGTYYIYTASGLHLRVSSATASEGDTVYLDYNMCQPTFMWKIEQLPDRSFKISSAHTGNEFVLKGQYSTLPPINTCIGAYTDDTDNLDEWYIYESTADLYAHLYLGKSYGDTTLLGSLNTVRSLCSTEGKMLGWGYNTVTKAKYLELLDTVDFFTHITTGSSGYFNVHSYPSAFDYSVDIDDYFASGELSNIKFAMLGSCYSAATFNNACLARSIKDKGAQIVLGFETNVDAYALGTWSTVFYDFLLSGETVNNSVGQADASLYNTGDISSAHLITITSGIHVYGDGDTAPFD